MNMEEQKLVEKPLMKKEEFKDYLEDNRVNIVKDFYESNLLHLKTYESVKRFKSVRRAIKRGHSSLDGLVYPKRPFNNSKHCKNSLNDKKKLIYGQLKHRRTEQ